MKYVDEKYFKEDGDYIKFIGPYMEMYVPSYYKEKELYTEYGEECQVFGLLIIQTFNDVDRKSPNPKRVLNIPVLFTSSPSDKEEATLDLVGDGNKDKYTVLKYYANDILCPLNVTQEIKSFKSFLQVMLQGKIPTILPYDIIRDIMAKNMDLNGMGFDVPESIYELIIAEIYRDKKDPTKRFGMVYGKNPKMSPFDYKTASSRTITKLNSNFSSVIFENMDEMLVSSINRTVAGKPENPSPIEEVMKY